MALLPTLVLMSLVLMTHQIVMTRSESNHRDYRDQTVEVEEERPRQVIGELSQRMKE